MIPATVTALAHRDGTDVDFRHVLEILPAAAYTCDADGLITYFNQRAVATWGANRDCAIPPTAIVDRFTCSPRMAQPFRTTTA